MASITRLATNYNQALYLGNYSASPPQLAGLLTATNGALLGSGTYAGIAKGSKPLFAGNELANSGVPRPISIELMDQFLDSIYTACSQLPTIFISDSK